MNLNDLISKLRIIESNEVAPVHTDGPAEEEGIEIIGGPMGGMMGGMGHSEPPKQQDSVSMNVSLNGAGAQGVRDLMNILHNIEQGVDHTDHSDEHDHNEPIMGDMVDAMADEQMQFQPEQGLEEVQDDDGQTWGNSAYGDSGHHVHGIDSITMKGNDLASKGGHEPHKRQGGGNPYNESLVNRLSQMYQEIKEAEYKYDEAYNPNSVAAQHARDLEKSRVDDLKKKAEAGDEKAKAALKRHEDKKAAMRADFDARMER